MNSCSENPKSSVSNPYKTPFSSPLEFLKEEFYLIKGKENPYLLSIDREESRMKIFDNKITEFDFAQYLFARQAHFLKHMNWYHEGIERVKLFISDIFGRAIRELPPIQDQNYFNVFKHIWSIQAINGFLLYYHPRGFINDNPQTHKDLKVLRVNFHHHSILHLEQLYILVYGNAIDKIKVMDFAEEFQTLLDVFELGGVDSPPPEENPGIELSLFDIQEQQLKEVIGSGVAFLDYIYEEKVRYSQFAVAAGCRKIGQLKTIECIKYRIIQHK